jgi:hypothetical protein
MPFKLEKLGRFLLRGLRIGASTIAIVELLRSDWNAGISASLAWLVFLQVERLEGSRWLRVWWMRSRYPAMPARAELKRSLCVGDRFVSSADVGSVQADG